MLGNVYLVNDEDRRLIEANQSAIKITNKPLEEAVNTIVGSFDKAPAEDINEEKVIEAYNSYKEKLFNRYKLSDVQKPIGNNYVFEKDGFIILNISFFKGTTNINSGSYPNYWSYQRCHFKTYDTEGNIFLDIPYNLDINGIGDYAQTGCHNSSHSSQYASSSRYSNAVFPVFKGQRFELVEGDLSWFKVVYYEDRYYGYR